VDVVFGTHNAFEEPCHGLGALQPIGIYTIPEISYVGPPRRS
jgi:NAD(P) transhydrogenase